MKILNPWGEDEIYDTSTEPRHDDQWVELSRDERTGWIQWGVERNGLHYLFLNNGCLYPTPRSEEALVRERKSLVRHFGPWGEIHDTSTARRPYDKLIEVRDHLAEVRDEFSGWSKWTVERSGFHYDLGIDNRLYPTPRTEKSINLLQDRAAREARSGSPSSEEGVPSARGARVFRRSGRRGGRQSSPDRMGYHDHTGRFLQQHDFSDGETRQWIHRGNTECMLAIPRSQEGPPAEEVPLPWRFISPELSNSPSRSE